MQLFVYISGTMYTHYTDINSSWSSATQLVFRDFSYYYSSSSHAVLKILMQPQFLLGFCSILMVVAV